MMGLPAARRESPRERSRRPHLRAVPDARTRKRTGRGRNTHAAQAAARQAFVLFAVTLVVVAGLGAGRVWLSVQAAQASIDSGKLQTAIKQARYEGDTLEIQQSALTNPSRIEAEAVNQLGMAPAVSVTYLNMSGPTSVASPVALRPVAGSGVGLPVVLTRVMRVAAGEAHLVLAGDAGLASLR